MQLDLTGSNLFFVLVLFGAGLFCIMKGGDLFVDAATWIAESTGIPKFIIGATVVSFATTMPELLVSLFSAFEGNADIAVGNAAGSVTANTSLPELVTTIISIRKKQASLSVGNIIGANILDLTLIMPLCALLQGRPQPIERQGMLLDIPACLIIGAAVMVPALICGKFKRWMGILAGALYIAYLVIMFTCFGVA